MTAAKPAASLAEAVLALQADLPNVSKTKTAKVPTKGGGEYSYSYADLAAVSAAVLPSLQKHGLTFTCQPRRCGDGAYEAVGVLRHAPSGDSDEGALPLYGRTSQEVGSSLTYARRYLLGCMTGLVTDDDDDAQGAQGAPRTRRQDPPPTPEQALSSARSAAWGVFKQSRKDATQNGFTEAYEAWCAQPFEDAEVNDFLRFAAAIKGGEIQ